MFPSRGLRRQGGSASRDLRRRPRGMVEQGADFLVGGLLAQLWLRLRLDRHTAIGGGQHAGEADDRAR
jgi:hypothetical protein